MVGVLTTNDYYFDEMSKVLKTTSKSPPCILLDRFKIGSDLRLQFS